MFSCFSYKTLAFNKKKHWKITSHCFNLSSRYPLHAASGNGQVEAVKKLIQAGGDVNEKDDEYCFTPLHWASMNGHVEVVKTLIQAGGDINCQDRWGATPLHEASRNGHVEVITALLAAGADKTIKNKDGKTPRDVARNQATSNALR